MWGIVCSCNEYWERKVANSRLTTFGPNRPYDRHHDNKVSWNTAFPQPTIYLLSASSLGLEAVCTLRTLLCNHRAVSTSTRHTIALDWLLSRRLNVIVPSACMGRLRTVSVDVCNRVPQQIRARGTSSATSITEAGAQHIPHKREHHARPQEHHTGNCPPILAILQRTPRILL